MEVKWAQFAKVVLEIIVSLSRFMSMLCSSSYSHFIVPCLACNYLAGREGSRGSYTEPGSVGDISGSCTSEYGKHQVPFAFELYFDQ